jgi:membrane complex biogenesis BtpA family protein
MKSRFELPLGINVLRNDGRAALAVASAAGCEFIRVNVYTGARLTDQGILSGQAHRILRARQLLGSGVRVFADVAVKHSAPLAIRSLGDEVEDTVERGRADAVIVTGSATGKPTRLEDLAAAAEAAHGTPVYAGSGVTAANVEEVLRHAAGVIVGTALKRDGVTTNPVDPARVREFVAAVRASTKS